LGVDASHLDRCFLTGGTAHVPAVLSLFERRIGADRIHVGDHHTSVASGLALRGLDES
ncbi:MAG: putative chaperone protein, partial [Myxococcota bacterium]